MASSSGAPRASIVNMSKVKSRLLRPALTSHFSCRFSPPDPVLTFLRQGEGSFPGSDYSNTDNQEVIELSCSEASLPGSSLITNEINDDRTGVTERFAYRRQYDDRIDFTFYVDHDYKIINFFERWIAYCSGENLQEDLIKREYSYRVNYPDNYRTDSLYVTKFERDIESELQYRFIGAYPISITSMPISYDSSELLKCTVSFTYIRYTLRTDKSVFAGEPVQITPAGIPDLGISENPQFGVDSGIQTPIINQNPLRDRRTFGTQPNQINPGSGNINPPVE
jgi:hypothetical protein